MSHLGDGSMWVSGSDVKVSSWPAITLVDEGLNAGSGALQPQLPQ